MSRGGVSGSVGDAVPSAKTPSRAVIITALGVTQIFAWGTSYYLPAVLAAPIVAETGWSLAWVVGGLSLGLLTAGLVSPWVGRAIALRGGSAGVGGKRGASRDRALRAGAGAFAAGVSSGLARDRARHGRGAL